MMQAKSNFKDFKTIQLQPIKPLLKANLKLALSRRIVHDKGLVGCHVTGRQQTGKSVYALLVMYELYQGNIDEIFKHTAFTIQDLTKMIRDALVNQERMICVLWDDTSVHGSAMQYNIHRKLVQKLAAIGDTMGLATKGIIMTSPSGDTIKAFRNYDFYKAQIGMGLGSEYARVARGYEFGTSPQEQRWCKPCFRDVFDVRLPFYQRYYDLREKLSISAVDEMDTELDETDKSKITVIDGKKYTLLDLPELDLEGE